MFLRNVGYLQLSPKTACRIVTPCSPLQASRGTEDVGLIRVPLALRCFLSQDMILPVWSVSRCRLLPDLERNFGI
jgi:hypothetical protein